MFAQAFARCELKDLVQTILPFKHCWGLFVNKGLDKQSGRSPEVVALFSATNFSSNIIELLQLHDIIQI